MEHNIYTIFDEKADAFLPPFFIHNDGMAVREIGSAIADPNHSFSKNPQDYTLFILGTFNDATGEIIYKKKMLTTCLEIRARAIIEQQKLNPDLFTKVSEMKHQTEPREIL